MRVVLDTNVIISAAEDDYSSQARLMDAIIAGEIEAVTSSRVVREYRNIMRRLEQDKVWQEKTDQLLEKAIQVKPERLDVVIDDKDDLKFIEAAVAGEADFVVSNDRHLLDVGEVADMRIVTPTEAWQAFQESTGAETEWQSWAKGLGIGMVVLAMFFAPVVLLAQEDEEDSTALTELDEVAAKKAEIAELNKKIKDLQSNRDQAANEAELIDAQLKAINAKLKAAQLELKQTQNSLASVSEEKEETEEAIDDLSDRIAKKKDQLSALLRTMYLLEQRSSISIWLNTGSWGEVIDQQKSLTRIQNEHQKLIAEFKEQNAELKEEKEELVAQEDELSQLGQLLAGQKQELDSQEEEQAQFLAAKKEEQAKYEQKIALAKAAREEIEKKIFTLGSSGVKLEIKDATDMAKYASDLTGVRPELLMAMLKVESSLGTNIGSGKFPEDMHPASVEPFKRIMAKMERDPATAPISRSTSYGWGGAMGPGQIMPQTWEGLEPRVAALMKKPVADPYELTDAFVATAIMLADRGATSPAGEYEAINRYMAGANWQRFTWYGDRVLAVAKEYAPQFK